jgi:hypothetical protein
MRKEAQIMKETILTQVLALEQMSVDELQAKYKQLFGDNEPIMANKSHIVRRIVYRLQELEYGELNQQAQDKLASLTQELDPVNNKNARPRNVARNPANRDRRLPIPGTILTKEYKGTTISVKVLEKGFEYNQKVYKSLSSIVKEVTGAHWNGYLFFNL